MPAVDSTHRLYIETVLKGMDDEYSYVRSHYKELAQYIIPQRYQSLDEGKKKRNKERNRYILDGHATMAARTLASGMLFGATNPTHRWLRLSFDDKSVVGQRWVDIVTDLALGRIGRSNIYNTLSSTYLDLGVFGTSAMLIYEDAETLFRGYSSPAGEHRIMRDERGKVSYLGRKLKMTADQIIKRFGEENASYQVRRQYDASTRSSKFEEFDIYHLIEPNIPAFLPAHFQFRETYWERGGDKQLVLQQSGYYEKPFIAPRWEVVGNSTFGVSPGMDSLPDIIQLQHMTRRVAQGLDKQVSPPIVLDNSLRNQPSALMPNGITYVGNAAATNAKPLYTTSLPYQELSIDKDNLKQSISRAFFEDLFRAILDLRTVRSATEIEAATVEKLVLLGPVIGRIEDEALSDLVLRILGIMQRAGVIPPPPGDVAGGLSIDYDSILSAAQKAAGINNVERYMGALGQLLPVAPDVVNVVDFSELLRLYADRLNVPAITLRTREQVAQIEQQQAEQQQLAQQASIGRDLAAAAGSLSDAGT